MDDLSEIRQNISEGIASLSRTGPTPTEFEPTTEIEPEAVSFSSGTWRSSLVQVQGWLRLENNLDETSPESFLISLATGLGEPATAGEVLVLPRPGRTDRARSRAAATFRGSPRVRIRGGSHEGKRDTSVARRMG